MIKYIKLTCCMLLVFQFNIEAQTLDDYLKEVAENNPGLKASYAEFEASVERIHQVNTLPDPSLSFGYFISPIETRVGAQQAKVSLSQMFPWFGMLRAKEDVASLLADSKYQAFLNEKNKLFLEVKKAYYPIYEVNEHIRWQQENLRVLITYKTLATISFSNGKGALSDAIRVDIMIENSETEILLLKDKLKPLASVFNNLLNKPDSTLVIVSDKPILFNIEIGYRKDSLLLNNPILQAIDNKIAATEANEEVAKKKGLPQFGVGIDYAFINERTDINVANNGKNAIMPMVTMSLPIFRGKYKASVKEAELTKTVMTYRKDEMQNDLKSSYEKYWYEIDKSQQLNKLYDNQIEKTKQVMDLLYKAYSNSGNEFEEVLRMQQQLLKYEMAKVTAIKNFNIALSQLDYITAK